MSDTMRDAAWKLVPVEPDKLMLVKGENALHSSSYGDFYATKGEIEACYRAMLEAVPAPPVPADVQEITELMMPYVRACIDLSNAIIGLDVDIQHIRCEAAFESLKAALTALVDERDRLKFELAGVNAMLRPEWQPIETAPKDGTHILACDINNSFGWSDGKPLPPVQSVVHWWAHDNPGFYTSVNELEPLHPFTATHYKLLDGPTKDAK